MINAQHVKPKPVFFTKTKDKEEYNKAYNDKSRNYFEKHKQGNAVNDKQNKNRSSETQTNENKKPSKWGNYCRKNGHTCE